MPPDLPSLQVLTVRMEKAIKIMYLLDRWQPDLGVTLEIVMEPRRAALWGTCTQKVRL
jgi:hypothetical protein